LDAQVRLSLIRSFRSRAVNRYLQCRNSAHSFMLTFLNRRCVRSNSRHMRDLG
jgi:hypothetical protein